MPRVKLGDRGQRARRTDEWVQTSARFNLELYQRLRQTGIALGLSTTKVIEQAAREWLERNEPQSPNGVPQ